MREDDVDDAKTINELNERFIESFRQGSSDTLAPIL
jgi:hypothetical protein